METITFGNGWSSSKPALGSAGVRVAEGHPRRLRGCERQAVNLGEPAFESARIGVIHLPELDRALRLQEIGQERRGLRVGHARLDVGPPVIVSQRRQGYEL